MLMLQEIVLKTADRVATAASYRGNDSSVIPYAQKTYDRELQWSNGWALLSKFDALEISGFQQHPSNCLSFPANVSLRC